jgi:hypothetical protein
MKLSLKKNRRGIFYGFVVAIGLIFLHQILIETSLKEFLGGAVILYFIFVFEVYTNWFYSRKVLSQMEIPQVDSYTKASQIIHHLVLPSILYISYLGIIYFYQLSIPKLVIFFFSFFTFTLLFINVRAYYEDKFKLEEKTHYIFDIIKFIIFFQLTSTFLKIQTYFNISELYAVIAVALISLLINLFVVIRHRQLNTSSGIFISLFAGLIGLACFLLLSFTSFNVLAISTYLILVFYISSATIHHKLEGTLTKELLIEYFAVMLLALVIIQGLSN